MPFRILQNLLFDHAVRVEHEMKNIQQAVIKLLENSSIFGILVFVRLNNQDGVTNKKTRFDILKNTPHSPSPADYFPLNCGPTFSSPTKWPVPETR